MALAIAKAAPLRADIKLSQALSDYEAILSAEQRQSYTKSPPDANAVMALTCEIDRQNAGRRTRRCGARLTSFLNSVKGFTSVIDLIVSSSGNPIAGGVWGAVKIAIQTASGFESYFDSLSTFLMNVGLSSPRFEKYALLYSTSKNLQKELCNYYSVVINLCTRIVLFVRKPFIKQIASALRKPFEDAFGPFQKDLIRLGTEVKEETSLASKQLQSRDSIEEAQERKENSKFRATGAFFRRETANELEQARQWREDRAKSRFLNSFSIYNFEITLNQARKKGASTWIFRSEEYEKWTSSTSSSMLLCSGIVGAGKTVLCANVIEDLILNKSQGSSLGYFFCRSDEVPSLKAREIIGSLARQLFEDLPTEELRSNQVHHSLVGNTLSTEQILSDMMLLLPRHRQYIMVIDGLDECEYDQARALVGSIQSLLRLSSHIFRIFLTGRSDFASRVSEQLPPDFQIHISRTNNGPEISRFIEHALEDALESNKLKLRDPSIILKIQDALESGACEMFLWVVFQIDSICALNTDHDIISSLKDLPKGLPATFRRILSRLQDSAFADPGLGRKIFEIVAAAQEPLTLDELREAISITPGGTAWDGSRLVNDVLRSLESCGSLLIVDEELSTVHFAHSSVKLHLSSEPTDLDVRDYHIDLFQADINLGKVAVTYLNLDVLGNGLSKKNEPTSGPANGPAQLYTASVPSLVVRSALPKRDVVNRMALAILRGRKMPRNDSGLNLETSGNLRSEIITQIQDMFAFLPYCQKYWLYHSKNFPYELDRVDGLLDRLVNGMVHTVELPWAPERLTDLGEKFVHWVSNNRQHALRKREIDKLCYKYAYDPEIFDIRQLEESLSVLLYEDDLRSLNLKPGYRVAGLLQEAASHGLKIVVQLALQEGADINADDGIYGNALHAAVSNCHGFVAELLIKRGADVNLRGGKYGSALQAGVAKLGMDRIVELLIQKGADVNAYDEEHGTALAAAARINNVAALRLLLKAGADVNAHGKNCHTALRAAVGTQTTEAVFTLLDAGADVNMSGRVGESPLRVAARFQNYNNVKRLLDYGAIIDADLGTEQKYMEEFHTNHLIASELLGRKKIRSLSEQLDRTYGNMLPGVPALAASQNFPEKSVPSSSISHHNPPSNNRSKGVEPGLPY